jgi:LysM repeat protein
MNIRDLINRMESIELNEGLRLKDIEAQVGQEQDEQKRAQTLMSLAQANKLPGLYDPVSGYFVSADPDMGNGEYGSGQPKPRISATGTEDSDALLAKRGLVPPKANTSTFLRKLNPFKSSNQDYDTGIQGGSQAAIARQNKEDEELKQLTDLIPKYKALKDKLAALTGGNTDARTGQGIVPADQPLAEALMESFKDLFEYDLTTIPRIGGKIADRLPAIVRGAEKDAAQGGKNIVPRDPLQDVLPPLPNRVGEFVPPKPPDITDVTGRMKPNQPLMITYTKPPRPDITPQQWATGVPDAMKPSAWQWLKDNPKKSLAAAVALLAAGGSLVGGGQGNRGKDQVPNPDAAAKTDSSTTYQIQRGDVLSRIAQQNGVSVAELMAANPSIINPNNITAGATITIPPASGKPVYDQGVGSKPNVKPADSSSDQAERDDAAKES